MNFSQMSFDNGILHLANWVGNVIMPTIAAVFIIMAIVQFSKGQEFSHSMYGALACLMVSGLTRALETFASQRAWNNPDVYWMALITLDQLGRECNPPGVRSGPGRFRGTTNWHVLVHPSDKQLDAPLPRGGTLPDGVRVSSSG